MLKTGLVVVLLMSLLACGFHLRGSVHLPQALAVMNVMDASPATEIAPGLRRALQDQGVSLVEGASMTLQLHRDAYGKRVLSVDAQGRAQEYDLSYSVTFSLKGGDGSDWLSREVVTTSRELRFEADAVLATASEEERLKAEMVREAVNNVLRRLQNARPPAE